MTDFASGSIKGRSESVKSPAEQAKEDQTFYKEKQLGNLPCPCGLPAGIRFKESHLPGEKGYGGMNLDYPVGHTLILRKYVCHSKSKR